MVTHSFIRLLSYATTYLDMLLERLNFKTTFLHSELEEEIYKQHFVGFLIKNKDHVCPLKKSLYGLKESPR